MILGFLTYLSPALESAGYTAAAGGLAVGVYGLATLGWIRVLKRAAGALGPGVGSWDQGLANISLAAFFVGGGFAFMHSTLQTWATEVVPEARATVISLFAAAPLVENDAFGLLFALLAALVALPLGILGGLARRRYARK